MLHILNSSRSQVRFVKVDKNDHCAVAKARAHIEVLYQPRPEERFAIRNNLRLRELEAVLAFHHRGPVLSEDDAGLDDLHIAICHILRGVPKDAIRAIRGFAHQWAPWCGHLQLENVMKNAAADQRRWTADELAEALGLTFATRTLLKITTIGAVDMPRAKRQERRAANSRDRSAARRRKQGAKPQALSEARNKPWIAMGLGRSRYYDLKKHGLLDCFERTNRTDKKKYRCVRSSPRRSRAARSRARPLHALFPHLEADARRAAAQTQTHVCWMAPDGSLNRRLIKPIPKNL